MNTIATFLIASATLCADDIARLKFFTGCWEARYGSSVSVEEQWTKAVAGSLLGMGRTIKGDKTVLTEFMRIEPKDGGLVFVARVGDGSVPFKLVKLTDTEAVFENPANDFPQRIIYRKVDGGLFARIEGIDKGKEKGQDFPYKEVPCK
jgi:hypothetical protein